MVDPMPAPPVSVVAKYRKAVAVVAVSVATCLISIITDGITLPEWIIVAGVLVSSVNVAIVPNLDEGIGKAAKSISTFLLAGLAAAYASAQGGVSTVEALEIVLAAAAAVGVTALPNDWPPARLPANVAK